MDDRSDRSKNAFAIAAMILGICSILFICTLYLPIPLGALGCLFVILSKRRGKAMSGAAITGLITSILGILCGLFILIVSLFSAFTLFKPENREMLDSIFEQTYGVNFQEYLERLYGEDFDFDSYMEQFENFYNSVR